MGDIPLEADITQNELNPEHIPHAHYTAFVISVWSIQCNSANTCTFYDVMNITYSELEHAQLKLYMHKKLQHTCT